MPVEMRELVGRETDLETFDRLISEAGEGRFHLLQIEGEPGIGKSRLLSELASRTDQADWLVLRGSAAEFESELPFGAVIDALDAYLSALDPQAVNRLGEETLAVLAEAFPALAAYRAEARGPAISSERFRIHMAIRELLERLSGRAPLAVILDDLHWADQASVELIGYLLRRPPQAGIIVAIGNRSGLLDPNLAATIRSGRERVVQLSVEPLNLEQTAALTGTGGAQAEQLFTRTGGNPFYLLELVRAGVNAAAGEAIPDAVSAAISTEVASLSPGSRRFAEAAAVAGDPFDLDLAALIAGDASDLTSAIDELSGSGLIRPTEVPRRFSFRHPLVRSAIYDSVMPGTRLADHEMAAVALAGMDAPAAEQARHLLLAARPGDREAARTIGEAAIEALVSAPSLAADWSDAALRIMPPDEVEFRLRILGVKAQATASVSRFEEARASLLQAVDLLESDQVEMRVSLTSACAQIEELLGQHEIAHGRLTGLLADLEDQGSPAAITVMLNLAHDGFLRNDSEAMTKWSRLALEATLEQPDQDAGRVALARATRALCASFAGPIDDARENADLAAAAYDGFDETTLDRYLDGLVRLTAAELYLERFGDVIRHGRSALDASRRTGQGEHFPGLYPCIGTAAVTVGEFETAREVLDNAIDGARISNNEHSLAWSLFNRAMLAQTAGDLDLADQLSAESVQLLADQDGGLVKMWAGVMRGGAVTAMGRLEEGLKIFADSAGGDDLPEVPGSWRIWFLAIEVESLIALGRLDDAARICEIAGERAAEFDNGMSGSQALRSRASLNLALGNPGDAIADAREAIELADGVGARIEVADDRVVLAEALKQTGEVKAAVDELEAALDTFVESGTTQRQKLAEQRLRALGQKIHRRSGGATGESGVDSLTGREREVAELVVDRRTNREIAETLFLSQKTVETHLRNIFAKLGVSSRVEVARAFEEQTPV